MMRPLEFHYDRRIPRLEGSATSRDLDRREENRRVGGFGQCIALAFG